MLNRVAVTLGLVATIVVTACSSGGGAAPTAAPAADKSKPASGATAAPSPAAAKPGASPAASPAAAKPGQPSAAMEALIEGARKEGTLAIWSNTPKADNVPPLIEAFNKRFGLNTKVEQVEMTAADFTTRLVAEANAGRAAEADFGQVAIENVITLNEKGLIEKYDWVGTFGSAFPEIQKRVDKVVPTYRDQVLDYWHLAYAIMYRTDRFKEADMPKTWEGLADPKFKGHLILEGQGYPFNNFAPFWGIDKVLTLTTSYKANEPIFKRGSTAIATAITTGEGSLGVTTIGNAELAKSRGVPVDWSAPSEIPIAIEHAVVPKGAPHPNTARLFAAWLVTEGRTLFENTEKNGLAWPGEDSYLAKRLTEQGVKFSFVETNEQGQQTQEALKRISDAYLAQ